MVVGLISWVWNARTWAVAANGALAAQPRQTTKFLTSFQAKSPTGLGQPSPGPPVVCPFNAESINRHLSPCNKTLRPVSAVGIIVMEGCFEGTEVYDGRKHA